MTVNSSNSNIEYSIDGGLSWQAQNVFNNLGGGQYFLDSRSTMDTFCTLQLPFALESFSAPSIDMIEVSPISDCNLSDASITVQASGVDLEYSIDDVNWQTDNTFENLAHGLYTVYIRSGGQGGCIDSQDVEITIPINTVIISIDVLDVSDCNIQDGQIDIHADGLDLEYSIDDGFSWFDNSLFENLPGGIYNIIVRSKNMFNCVDIDMVTINAPMSPTLLDIMAQDPTDCDLSNGSIQIVADGMNLEYSIDDGLTWSSDNMFVGLPFGQYTILVRMIGNEDCTVGGQVSLKQWSAPTIIDVDIMHLRIASPMMLLLLYKLINLTSNTPLTMVHLGKLKILLTI